MLPKPVLLYDQPLAPNPMRLNLFLAEKGIEIERIPVDLMAGAHKSPDYLARVGAPQVPALELEDGTVITETQAIARYLEALHPEPNLLGRGPLEAALIEMWQRRAEFGLFAAVGHSFRHSNPKMAVLEQQCPDWAEVNRGRIDGHLAALDRRLEGRDWIAADRLTMADITAYVAANFRRIIRHEMPGGLDNLAAWMARIAARPATAALETKR
ncbi:glutathione S-transferase [Paralimibaculum aggregatum]|uniref:Glutathione S-transferase n=1 Tax=Paralimibaculum aggregatum TaxID=3036245 RepID=A0ABQ6LSC7_9RHOB|nr:glutathione S-transferase family protein [Limibaculum sp. NKW23]GMG84981.1 glutathione S-transferase [Limibaculum sp. NKW23]